MENNEQYFEAHVPVINFKLSFLEKTMTAFKLADRYVGFQTLNIILYA